MQYLNLLTFEIAGEIEIKKVSQYCHILQIFTNARFILENPQDKTHQKSNVYNQQSNQ